jgi:uncharacterized repeat protein (TIGR01451 family)
VVVFGNTLAHDCGAMIQLPDGVTASCAGQPNVTDTAPDLFWRDNVADASIEATQARTSATLSIPAGAKVTYARLYWGALKQGATADTTAILDWLGGPSTTIQADDSWVVPYGLASHPDWAYYQATGDATKFVSDWGAGDFRVSDVEALPLPGLDVDRAFSAWTLVVFYERDGDELRNLALFDGLSSIDPGLSMPSAEVTLNGILVPPGFSAKMTAFAYEGDLLYGGDHFTINGTQASDAQNPVDNFFNSSRSYLGVPVSGDLDVPRLSGAPGSMSGYDLDTVDITKLVKANDTSAVVGADSTKDIFLLGGFVTSITNLAPDFVVTKTAVDLNGGALLPGDEVEYTITATNKGNDPSVHTSITDVLDTGLSFVPGSLTVGGAGKTDQTGDDVADYNAGSRTATWRIGTGATSSKGGQIDINGSVTVSFRAKVTASSGQVANQALVSGGGASGFPDKTWQSDGDPDTVGNQTTVVVIKECQSDAECSGTKPHCNTGSQICEGCKTDSDCSNPMAPACQPDGSCGQCSATNQTQCKDPTPACSTSTGTCVLCTPGTPDKGGNADKCKTSTDGPVCVTGTDNSNFCGCQIDSDCSTDKKSGKVCDAAVTLKCIDGCRGTGGNGCPDGLVCTSKDSSLGKCVKDSTPETTDAACSDGKDNDGDGKVDCDDPDCRTDSVTVCAENTDAKCKDGKDNDGDGKIDCDDSGCSNNPAVTVCPTAENTNATCSDGKDNDGDGKVDCDDPDCKGEKVTVCAATKESSDADCADGKDNDGNGLIDCKDPNCIGSKPCPAENTNETCSDGKDNDNDGLIDCSDPDCKSASITVCGDENTDAACKDGKDNDGDGLVDCKDPNCSDNPKVTVCPTPENSNEKCSDKMDNDGDGKVDCDDSDCNKNPAVTVCAGNVGNGGAGGAGGAGGKGGAAGMAGGVDTGTPVGNGDSADVAQDGGCGCVVAGKEPAQAPGNVILAAFAGLAALVSRRRSRR